MYAFRIDSVYLKPFEKLNVNFWYDWRANVLVARGY